MHAWNKQFATDWLKTFVPLMWPCTSNEKGICQVNADFALPTLPFQLTMYLEFSVYSHFIFRLLVY
jgi:hypothetical protein